MVAMIDFAQVADFPKDMTLAKDMKQKTLGDWMEEQMRQRRIGVNEFSRLCRVSSGTISKYQSAKPPHPTMKFLRKLSEGTGVPLYSLLAIVDPQLEDETKVDPEILAMAHRLMSFPEQTRDMLVRVMETMEYPGDNH